MPRYFGLEDKKRKAGIEVGHNSSTENTKSEKIHYKFH